MARRRHRFSTFSLSFLDIMSCGFGAVALIFLIIKHDANTQVEVENQELLAEVSMLEEDVRDGRDQLVKARNTVSQLDQELAEAQGLARRINENLRAARERIAELDDNADDQQIKDLEAQLAAARQRREELEEQRVQQGNDVRRFVGEGERQYLTGLKLGGARILILVDASSSMLDDSLVNIIRRRNMSDEVKRLSPKWLRTVETVQWLTAQLPKQSSFQLYTFNTEYSSTKADSEGTWLSIGDGAVLEEAVLNLQKVVPRGGTSLENVLYGMREFDLPPDNIYLITDGLPTQGRERPRRGTVTGSEREKLFARAVEQIPYGVPVNVILLPMEGDPMAAAAYWNLALNTGGSFLTPSEDWP
ncbi:VWA domain-containing protein [Gilvimarinus sp. F26214L]|uniref:VWA domain-containing protein n=1 Tax=Gilvimarinus sp. DZF01 TaxID=3461371 RepID=UPI0040464892